MVSKIKIAVLALVLVPVVIAGYLWQAGFLAPKVTPPAGPVEKIVVGTAFNALSGLLYIAQDQGYDKKYGLEVHLKAYPSGKDAVNDLRAGRLDVACCAGFILVSEIFAGGKDLRGLGIVSSGNVFELIARRDRSINRPEDLRGKTIGTPMVHSARFFLARFLTFNNIALKEVNLVEVDPSDLAGALAGGKVDAVMAWEPRSYKIMEEMGNDAVAWPAQEGQDLYWLLITREEVVKERGAALEKLLRALAEAANFAKKKPEEVRKIIAQRTKVPLADLQGGRFTISYDLFLDQALLLAMEDEARWMINNKLTDQTRLPNYLDYIDPGPLLKVDPKAVRIIIPKDERAVAPAPAGTGQEHR
jgi:NitT/TauT family transport system substrate-binding protein